MTEADRRRFRTSRIMQLPLGASQRLAHLPESGTTVLIDGTMARILERCRTFRPLETHAREVCRALSIDPERLPEVVQTLRDLGEGGLLVALEDLVRRGSAREEVPPISTVGVVTKDRPEALQEGLVSYIEHCRHHGRNVDYVVCDDSESSTAREACRELIGNLARRYGVAISYAGHEEKRNYAAELARTADAPLDLVEFALFGMEGCGCTIGANRNAMLLHCAGELMYSADDDTVCRAVRHPNPGRRLRLGYGDPYEIWPYASREAALAAASYDERCLLTLHEELLGKSLSSVLIALDEEADYDSMSDHQVGMLLRGTGSIVLTESGILGDSGMHSGARLLADGGDTHTRVVQSEAAYRSALTSREILRMSQLAVTQGGSFTGAGFGLDLRATLPPFLPVARAEDTLFGVTVTQMSDDYLFGYPEVAVLHVPKESRSFPPNYAITVAGQLRFAEAIWSLIFDGELGGTDRRQLRDLSERLIRVGRLDDQRFKTTMTHALWSFSAQRCWFLEATLKARPGSPAYWAKDAEALLAAIRASLTHDDFWLSSDLRDGRSAEETAALMRRLILKFGQLLGVWAQLLDAARSLRSNGHRLARRPG